jgi:predicted ATP-grasp superfamily ATP-dependent carboligase
MSDSIGVRSAKIDDFARKWEIPCPQTFRPQNEDEIEALGSQLPLAIKPALKENFFYATGAKAWRAQTMEELRQIYGKDPLPSIAEIALLPYLIAKKL